jgi:hypothetical protein
LLYYDTNTPPAKLKVPITGSKWALIFLANIDLVCDSEYSEWDTTFKGRFQMLLGELFAF